MFVSLLRLHPASRHFPYTPLFRSFVSPIAAVIGLITDPGAKVAVKRFSNGWDGSSVNASQRLLNRFTATFAPGRSEEHTSELQSRGHLVCRLLLEIKKR